ncbi:MAG: hypothetical protein A2046_10905 [Bacteroidetes bacterium GWA2_30_7]|nr:MAG: hypothetical protein A2046_10905 [Bacteroidetes bacterium GWA2_30_7]
MDLKGILAISGHQGLFKLISQAKNSIIVESLIDKTRMPAYASTKISALDDIAIYTDEEEVPLKTVLKNMFEKEKGKQSISHKASNDEIKSYFEEILPNYDKDRVYVSDMKKIINWYNILHQVNLLNTKESEPAKVAEEIL